jgi:hypothetical protein
MYAQGAGRYILISVQVPLQNADRASMKWIASAVLVIILGVVSMRGCIRDLAVRMAQRGVSQQLRFR